MEAIRREHDIWSASQSKGEQIYFPIKWLERNGGDYMRGGEGGQEVLLRGFFPCASSFLPVENACKKQADQNGNLSLWFQALRC